MGEIITRSFLQNSPRARISPGGVSTFSKINIRKWRTIMEVVKMFHHDFLQKVQITNQYSRCLTKVEPVGHNY